MFILEIVDNPNIVPPDNNPVVTVIDDDSKVTCVTVPRVIATNI